jgi:nucleotide-binding universal stress UspA family protein
MTRFEASARPRRQPWPGSAESRREAVVSTDAARGARRDPGGMTSGAQTWREPPADSVFARVVVGVDGTGPSFEACRQAARLLDPDGSLELVAVVHLAGTVHAGFAAPRHAASLEREAREALLAASEIAGPTASAELMNGRAAESLLRRLEERQTTLVAVGTHGHSRASEIVLGGVAGELLHAASCSVLVARTPASETPFPRSVLAGIDGSPEAEAALDAAEALARRLGAPLRVVTALGGKGVDLDRVRARAPRAELLEGAPAEVLVRVAAAADLLVVGSRGLHGPRALGSVSERVAHEAPSSVLVVRSPAA